jgi:hypothetical protein
MRCLRFCAGVFIVVFLALPAIAWAQINVGGAVRFGYSYEDWNAVSKDKGGNLYIDTVAINFDGEINDLILSAEYRFYPTGGMPAIVDLDGNTLSDGWHMLHHGYIGYDFTENWQGQFGVHMVPFGITPYAANNFWGSGAYYLGFEDDYSLGFKTIYNQGPWDLTLAYYMNEALGDSGNLNRYSYAVYSGDAAGNEETNQGNIRLAYAFEHGPGFSTEFGISGQAGQIYNTNTTRNGSNWAGAVHMVGNYDPWNFMLQVAHYNHDLKNPDGIDDDRVTVGAFGWPHEIPAQASFGIFNVAYTVPVSFGPVSALTFYSDNTYIIPDQSDWNKSWLNVVGCMISADPVYTYIDIVSAENMIWIGNFNMAGPDTDTSRHTLFNINVGYYF